MEPMPLEIFLTLMALIFGFIGVAVVFRGSPAGALFMWLAGATLLLLMIPLSGFEFGTRVDYVDVTQPNNSTIREDYVYEPRIFTMDDTIRVMMVMFSVMLFFFGYLNGDFDPW